MSSYKVEPIPTAPITILGEGPHWDIETQSLYYVDIPTNGVIHRFDHKEQKNYKAEIENAQNPSFIIPLFDAKDHFAVGLGHRLAIVQWDGRSPKAIIDRIFLEVDSEHPENRWNDGKADPNGRLFAGTMGNIDKEDFFEFRTGSLYSVAKDSPIKKIRENIGISNGLCWNEQIKKFYYIDSFDANVKEYDWDATTGEIDTGTEKIVIDFSENGKLPEFLPDGMTIDRDGYLYVATFKGSKILKVNPKNGEIEQTIQIPCEQITSAAFGGPNLDILYVTTSSINDKPEPAGATFQVTGLGAVGLPMQKVRL